MAKTKALIAWSFFLCKIPPFSKQLLWAFELINHTFKARVKLLMAKFKYDDVNLTCQSAGLSI